MLGWSDVWTRIIRRLPQAKAPAPRSKFHLRSEAQQLSVSQLRVKLGLPARNEKGQGATDKHALVAMYQEIRTSGPDPDNDYDVFAEDFRSADLSSEAEGMLRDTVVCENYVTMHMPETPVVELLTLLIHMSMTKARGTGGKLRDTMVLLMMRQTESHQVPSDA